ncbi:Nucleotidyl transferase possibly involved in threonylcarbamoyladenosine formation [Paramagnetospirillum magnetotacticum MS-1]|uniref:Nucleotidyl transferase possibly involved in threonylcarbamoyladenosine formation n=1 Tax=Paramagnetospirillum magnetotacticum MS-1 TaxID=272627 RepID=A0A0C2U7I8_PARME|nr:nucleotidyltransferase family protein [Paramagnetospirillum magnetotacticum]KIL97437.1 Nucleotidyl transferase possibly involved in threonylcarbamoyladenosine formation [Paramagnetospirillum magnetotacticum MS-1]
MSAHITHAMVLAAGLGLRMRPITLTTPKPLVSVAGRTMLDRALDHVERAGIDDIVVNTHWLADKVVEHLAGRGEITLSHEPDLLETGGGVAKALSHLGHGSFYVVNSDIIWTDGKVPALTRLARMWNPDRMDALLLLQPVERAVGYEGKGDFFLDGADVPHRRGEAPSAPHLFSGVQVLHHRLFEGAPEGKFSLNVLYDRAAEQRRLFGLVHDGNWYHVGTPQALPEVERLLAQSQV